MKREIIGLKVLDTCCPGHDMYPCDTYKNKRSKKARAKSKQVEHQVVRSIQKRDLNKEIKIS